MVSLLCFVVLVPVRHKSTQIHTGSNTKCIHSFQPDLVAFQQAEIFISVWQNVFIAIGWFY